MIPHQAQPLERPAGRAATRSRIGLDVVVLAGALALFAFLAFQMTPFVPDDSYISYRYAENLATGSGLRFNPGDAPVEGYSNFLWIVLLAGAARLGATLTTAGVLLGGLFGGLTVIALWVLLRRLGRAGWELIAPVGLLAVAAPLLLYAVSGMETALFAFLLMALMLAAERLTARPAMGWALVLAAIGVLTALARPEGVVALPGVVFCLGVFAWRDKQRWPAMRRALLVVVLLFIAGQVAYHLWRETYFDAFWPTPFLSKGSGFIDSWRSNVGQFLVRQTHYYTPMGYYYAAIALPAVVAATVAWRRGERHPIEWTALILAAGFAAVYFNFVDWMPGMRYYAPLIALLLVPFSLLGPRLRRSDEDGNGRTVYLLLAAALALFSLSSLAALRLDAGQLQASTEASLVALGRWLDEVMPPDTTLAISDVGATPYYADLRTIDINPKSLTDRHIAENGWSADYFFATDPDVVVITAYSLTKPDFYGLHEELFAMPRFQDTYERIGVVRNDWYQDRSYWVFVRRGQLPTAEQMATFPTGIEKR